MIHVYPLNDLCAHDLDGLDCACGVVVDWDNDMVIHGAYDGRDLVEAVECGNAGA